MDKSQEDIYIYTVVYLTIHRHCSPIKGKLGGLNKACKNLNTLIRRYEYKLEEKLKKRLTHERQQPHHRIRDTRKEELSKGNTNEKMNEYDSQAKPLLGHDYVTVALIKDHKFINSV